MVLTVCATLWSNHLAVGKLNTWRLWLQWVFITLYDLLAWLVISIVIAGFTVHHDCVYTERMRVSQLLMETATYRKQIQERYTQTHTLQNIGDGLIIERSAHIQNGFIAPDGSINVASDDPGVVFILRPIVKDGQLSWECAGSPRNALPRMCRETTPL